MINERTLLRKVNVTTSTIIIDKLWTGVKFASVFCMCLALLLGCGEEDLDDPVSNLDDPVSNLDDPVS